MSARIHLQQGGDGRWKWAYIDGNLELVSNGLYATVEEARAAARLAYPDVALADTAAPAGARPGRRPSPWSLLLGMAALWRAYRRARRS